MTKTALETLLKAVVSCSVAVKKQLKLLVAKKGKTHSAADLNKVAGGGGLCLGLIF